MHFLLELITATITGIAGGCFAYKGLWLYHKFRYAHVEFDELFGSMMLGAIVGLAAGITSLIYLLAR